MDKAKHRPASKLAKCGIHVVVNSDLSEGFQFRRAPDETAAQSRREYDSSMAAKSRETP